MDKGGLGRGGWLARTLIAGLMGCSAAAAASARTIFPADPPIPVQKPGFSGAARTIELPSVLSPFASPDAPGDAATGSEAPLSNQFPSGAARPGDANGALRVEIPALPKTTVSPSLRLDGNGTTNPNDIRVAPPRDQEFNPTPGLNATVDLGDMTLGTSLSQSLKGTGPRIGPDGRPTGDGTSVGVDMKMKF